MELKEILNNLEKALNSEIAKLFVLGKKAKEEVQKENGRELPNKKLQRIYVDMTKIVKGFGPVEYLVRQLRPDLNPLFDQLLIADWGKDVVLGEHYSLASIEEEVENMNPSVS